MKKKSTVREWIKATLVAFFTILLFRIFLFEAFTIPSASMEKTLMTGDYILVSKLSYGPRLPITPLSFPFAHKFLPFTENTSSFLDWIQIPYFRLFGSPSVKRNDVVVFNYPMEQENPVDQRTYYVKRCVGLPGDTLEIKRGMVYINNKYRDDPDNLQYNYKVLTNADSINSDTLAKLGITEGGRLRGKNDYWFVLNAQNASRIRKVQHVTSAEPLLDRKENYFDYMFPENETFLWNPDYFGPVYIPRSGDSIHLTVDSLPLYERIISVYEKNTLRVSNDSVFINNNYSTHYTFKMNYFFMMGDNRHNSTDSRFWGFVPEDHIVGKAVMVLLSVDKSKGGTNFRSDRWFRRIRN